MNPNLCSCCQKKPATKETFCITCFMAKTNLMVEEFKKCKESPYYFATNYLKINGKPFTTSLSEQMFNDIFGADKIKIVKLRKGTVIVKK